MGIGDWFKRKLAMMAIATANVEKNAFGGEKNHMSDNIGQEHKLEHQRLSSALKQGEVTQQVKELRWRMYKILDQVDGMKTRIIGTEKDAAGDKRNITETYSVKTIDMSKFKMEPSDKNKLEIIVNNDSISTGMVQSMEHKEKMVDGEISPDELNSTEKEHKIVMVNREFPSKINIEQYTLKLVVRTISEEEKMLEFYVSKYPDEYDRKTIFLISEIKKCMLNPRSTNIIDISEVGFLTTNSTIGVRANQLFEYKINNFIKIVEFEGYYVIKFSANILVNGEDVFEQYRLTELDQKYETNEKKDIR